MYNFFKEKIFFEEYNRRRLKKLNNLKREDDLKSFVKNQYAEECDRGKVKNDNQREAFAVALTQL